eukprot:UN00749
MVEEELAHRSIKSRVAFFQNLYPKKNKNKNKNSTIHQNKNKNL